MKTEFQAKFLSHLAQKKKEEGFTLIELLVVIIIIGILSAIALPSFLNQANKAKQSEAKQYVASMNKGQQAYYTEQSAFSDNLDTLGLGIKSTSTNYTYSIALNGTTSVTNRGTSQKEALKHYAGVVYLEDVTIGTTTEKTSRALMCEAATPGTTTNIGLASTSCPTGASNTLNQ